jgi:hypothetical protein
MKETIGICPDGPTGPTGPCIDKAYLSANGWIVELWSDPRTLQAECEEDFSTVMCNRSTVIE